MRLLKSLKNNIFYIGVIIIGFLLFLLGRKNDKIGDLIAEKKYQGFKKKIEAAREAKIESEFQFKKADKDWKLWRQQYAAKYPKLDNSIAPKRLK